MKTATEKRARGVGRTGRRGLSDFAGRLLDEWERRGWPSDAAHVVVAVSGGADSAALLLALDELTRAGRVSLCVIVAHLDHGLRGERGEADAVWVAAQASALGLAAVVGRADVEARARARKDNLEQAARGARYEFLGDVARAHGACAVLTAHTLDDQAETILLRLLRGSGAGGLAGILPERELSERMTIENRASDATAGEGVRLLRPLVAWARRADTVGYCRERGVEFRADEMNEDERFARVRVRRRLLPLLETFNPRAVEALARTAELLGEDASALEAEAARLLEDATPESESEETSAAGGAWPLRVEALASAARAVRRRALRQWIARGRGDLRRVEHVHVLAVEKLLEGTRGGRVAELPGGCRIERRRGWLCFRDGSAEDARNGAAGERGTGRGRK
ncbi:MAG TPA: tRNA lysidine(34) synthetase TilS [Pyrinomonadaceae bacterium]